jgi:uncharacterized protein YkvS
MTERDTKTVKIIVLWILVIVAILEVAIMVDVGLFIDAQDGITGAVEIVPDKKY